MLGMCPFKVECMKYVMLQTQIIKRLDIVFIKSTFPPKKKRICCEFYETVRQVINLIPLKAKLGKNKHNEKRQTSSLKPFLCLMQTVPVFTYCITACWPPFFIPTVATSKTAAPPDVAQLTGISDESRTEEAGGAAALTALLFGSLL